jgi:hypothetical protein
MRHIFLYYPMHPVSCTNFHVFIYQCTYLGAGMALLAVLSHGLSIYVFGFINKEELKFS